MARQRKTSIELAEVWGCSQSSASRRMTGEVGMTLDDIALVADWLGVSLEAFLDAPQPERTAS